jgi:hypothetical protein
MVVRQAGGAGVAKQVKVDHKTVGSVRAEKEATGELSPVEKRVGADGKARAQPPCRPVVGKPAIDADTIIRASLQNFAARTAADDRLAEKLRKAQLKIIGLESEVEELKAENARLREELAKKQGEVLPPKRRGRPPGSKNKPKPAPAVAVDAVPEAVTA